MLRTASAVFIAMMLAGSGGAEPCNPAIDGTHCAKQPPARLDLSLPPTDFDPIQSLGNDLSITQQRDAPATLGAITFHSDGTRCIGLFRRSTCR